MQLSQNANHVGRSSQMSKDLLIASLQNEIAVLKSQGLGGGGSTGRAPDTAASTAARLQTSSGCGSFSGFRNIDKYRRVRDSQTLCTPQPGYNPYTMSQSRWETSNAAFKYRKNTPIESSFALTSEGRIALTKEGVDYMHMYL